MKKYCPGCNKDHPIDEFATAKNGHRKHCKDYNNKHALDGKNAKIANEIYLNNLINKVWRRKANIEEETHYDILE